MQLQYSYIYIFATKKTHKTHQDQNADVSPIAIRPPRPHTNVAPLDEFIGHQSHREQNSNASLQDIPEKKLPSELCESDRATVLRCCVCPVLAKRCGVGLVGCGFWGNVRQERAFCRSNQKCIALYFALFFCETWTMYKFFFLLQTCESI